jgi:hypothetical protein
MLDQVNTLLDNGWIEQCGGAWGSPLVFAPKPHQETITNIDDFVISFGECVSATASSKQSLTLLSTT